MITDSTGAPYSMDESRHGDHASCHAEPPTCGCPELDTTTVFFTACNGKVRSWGSDADRREAQLYVNRNNHASYRRDGTTPYHLLAYTIPATTKENDR